MNNYRFNGGYGAALCAKCRVIVDEGLSYDEYVDAYPDDQPMCWMCVGAVVRRRDKEVEL